MRVQFSLPGLRRGTLTVPTGSWLTGEHQPAGAMLDELIQHLAGPPDA